MIRTTPLMVDPKSTPGLQIQRTSIATALLLGVYQVLLGRNVMAPDGIAYLDLGDRIWTKGWSAAVNGYWSPLYPAILGGVLKLFRPSMNHEFLALHLVNLLLYGFAVFAFAFFWGAVQRYRLRANDATSALDRNSSSAWILFGYGLLVWGTLSLIGLHAVTPDLIVCSLVFLAAGIVLALYSGDRAWNKYLLLGAVLGLGYLAKAAMFPLAIAFLVVALFASTPSNLFMMTAPRLLASVFVFLAISACWVIPMSQMTGHLTFGESAAINYAWNVGDVLKYGRLPLGFHLVHPVKKLFDEPPVYWFSGPVVGSYPFWTDPSYWLAGLKPHFTPAGQIRAVAANVGRFLNLPGLLAWAAALIFLALLSRDVRAIWRNLVRMWVLLVPGLAGLALYLLVFLEGRYVAPFLVMLCAATLVAVTSAGTPVQRSIMPALAITTATVLVGAVLIDTTIEAMKRPTKQDGGASLRVAVELKRLGFHAGDPIGSIGDAFIAYWARLDRLEIVAEIPQDEAPRFWSAGSAAQRRIVEAFQRAGARAIVADIAAEPDPSLGWRRLANTNHYVYWLPSARQLPNATQ